MEPVVSPGDVSALAGWATGLARDYRSLGFFAGRPGSDADLGAELLSAYEDDWGEPVDPTRGQLAEMFLLAQDRARVWWQDLENVLPGEAAYARALVEWGAIARGAFAPTGISETWADAVTVRFTCAGREWRFVHADPGDDFLDVRILHVVNAAIAPTGHQFVVADEGGMPNFVTVLSAPERDRLARERGWRFYALEPPKPFPV